MLANSARGKYRVWDDREVEAFNPTVVFNFACVTSGYEHAWETEKLRKQNSLLLQRFEWIAQLPRVRTIVSTSSGAAVESQHPDALSIYGQHKLQEERIANAAANETRTVVIARAWSLSGPLVSRPRAYAFSDFVLQARQGSIEIASQHPTFRRYCSAGDFLTVCALKALTGESGVVESGGDLIELGELAQRIRAVVNPSAEIRRIWDPKSKENVYASTGEKWDSACNEVSLIPMNLEEQIKDVAGQLQIDTQ